MLAEAISLPVTLDDLRSMMSDPFVRRTVTAATVFLLFLLVLKVYARRRQAREIARTQASIRRGLEAVRLQQDEIHRLAEQIVATSSTGRITGFTIVRQVETVFSEGRPSSVAAVELVKAYAAQKGANAIVNLQSQQTPGGKWVAVGDAVVVRVLGRRPDGGVAP